MHDRDKHDESPEKLPAAREGGFWHRRLLFLVGLVAFLNSLGAPLIFDDLLWAPAPWDAPRGMDLRQAIFRPSEGPLHGRPLTGISIWACCQVAGWSPVVLRLFNLVIHICVGLTLYAVLVRLLSRRQVPLAVRRSKRPLAYWIVLLWMVHPLVCECVVYISQRTESMCALFLLLALYASIRARRRCEERRWTMVAVVCVLLGTGTKEVIAVTPLLVAACDLAFRSRGWKLLVRKRARLWGWLLLSWPMVGLCMYVFPRTKSVGTHEVTSWEYLLNQSLVIGEYIKLAFWPHPLIIDWGYPQEIGLGQAIVPGVLITIAAAASFWWTLRGRPVGFAGAWFFLLLAPTSSVLPILTEVGAERRMYLPLVALVGLFVVGTYLLGFKLSGERKGEHISRLPLGLQGLLMVVFLSLLVVTWQRNREYYDPIGLWQAAADARPDNSRASYNLARLLQLTGQLDKAREEYLRGLVLRPKHGPTHNNLGLIYTMQGEFAEAEEHLRAALQTKSQQQSAAENLAWLLATSSDSSAEKAAEAVTLGKQLVAGGGARMMHLDTLAAAYARVGEYDKAVETIQEAIDLAERGGQKDLVRILKERLELYQAGKPYLAE